MLRCTLSCHWILTCRSVSYYSTYHDKPFAPDLTLYADRFTDHSDGEPIRAHARLVLDGEIDAGTARSLDASMTQVLSDGPTSVVIDMRNVSYISSAGIGIFIYFFGEISKNGKRLLLFHPTPIVHEILTLLRLEEHIPILMSEEEVEAALV